MAKSKGLPGAEETGHSQVQAELLTVGRRLGYDVWAPRADWLKVGSGQTIRELVTARQLPQIVPGNKRVQETVERIDVVWLDLHGGFAAAFEVESTTPIYSGILRMADLITLVPRVALELFLVAPEQRRQKVINELNRPVFSKGNLALDAKCRLITFENLRSEVQYLGARLEGMKVPAFLNSVAESCELPDGSVTIPED